MDPEINELATFQSQNSEGHTPNWCLFGKTIPKSECVYICQTVTLVVVILASIINISLGHKSDIWLVLLSTSLGKI